jgi:hypothetical protein
METLEPKNYVRVCVERELTNTEFDQITEIIDDEIGDIVGSDEVIEHINENGMVCYLFELATDIHNSEQGTIAGDLISYEIDQVLPENLQWEFEASTEDVELDVPDDVSEEEIREAAVKHYQNLLKG